MAVTSVVAIVSVAGTTSGAAITSAATTIFAGITSGSETVALVAGVMGIRSTPMAAAIRTGGGIPLRRMTKTWPATAHRQTR